MPEDVKCADCGYLAVRHKQNRQLLDAEAKLRRSGHIPGQSIGGHDLVYDDHPICFMGVVEFATDSEAGLSRNEGKCREAMQRSRTCNKFTPWIQGFTPKEHYEMLQEAERLKWQAKREADDKADRERREKEARDFQAEQAALNRRYNTRNLWALAAIVLATLLGPVIGAMIARQAVTTPDTATSLPETSPQTSTADSSPPPSSPE